MAKGRLRGAPSAMAGWQAENRPRPVELFESIGHLPPMHETTRPGLYSNRDTAGSITLSEPFLRRLGRACYESYHPEEASMRSYLAVPELAGLLGYTPRYVRGQITKGLLPAYPKEYAARKRIPLVTLPAYLSSAGYPEESIAEVMAGANTLLSTSPPSLGK